MLENSTSLTRAFPASVMPSRLMGGIETIDGAMNMPVPFVQEGVTDLYVLEKDSDSPYRGKEERSVAFERWPNIGEEIVTPTQAQASLSSIITQLQTSARAELPEAKKESFTQISFQARSEGLSVESLLFALQEFLVGKRVLIHVSSENALKAMQAARDMSNERQIKLYEEQSKVAENERNHQRWSGLITTVCLGALSALVGTLSILPILAVGGSLLTFGGVSGVLMLMGAATSMVKAGLQGAQIHAASQGEAKAVKDLQKGIDVSGYVEITFTSVAFAADLAVMGVGYFGIKGAVVESVGTLTTIGEVATEVAEEIAINKEIARMLSAPTDSASKFSVHGIWNALRKGAAAERYTVLELDTLERMADGSIIVTESTKLAEDLVMAAEAARPAPSIQSLSSPEFVSTLKEALKRVRWQNFDLKKIDEVIEAAHKQAQIVQESKQALEYSKIFNKELSAALGKELIWDTPKFKYAFISSMLMRSAEMAASGVIGYYAAEASYLANTLNAQLKLEREVQQLLTQKAITDKLEDLEKNTQEMGKILKDIVEWVTQFIEAKRKAIDALALIR